MNNIFNYYFKIQLYLIFIVSILTVSYLSDKSNDYIKTKYKVINKNCSRNWFRQDGKPFVLVEINGIPKEVPISYKKCISCTDYIELYYSETKEKAIEISNDKLEKRGYFLLIILIVLIIPFKFLFKNL